jgi:hypothetical protein
MAFIVMYDANVLYDKRLIEAAVQRGLSVASPA